MSDKKIVQKIVLGGVVVKDDKILILQRNKDEDIFPSMWELPSGKREPLESSESSLIREIKEETGLTVKIVVLLSIFDYQIERADEIKDSTQINFIVKSEGDIKTDLKISFEHQNFAWIREDEIENYNVSESVRDLLKKSFDKFPSLKDKGLI